MCGEKQVVIRAQQGSTYKVYLDSFVLTGEASINLEALMCIVQANWWAKTKQTYNLIKRCT